MKIGDQRDLFGDDGQDEPVPGTLLAAAIARTNPIRIFAGGHDVTDRMPLTRARLEKMREEEMAGQRLGIAPILQQ